MFSYNTPRRGTVEYLRYVVQSEPDIPSNWTTRGSGRSVLADVDSSTKQAIINLVQSTWNPAQTSFGRDAFGLRRDTGLMILNVERIENPDLFRRYKAAKQELLFKKLRSGRVCEKVGDLPKSSGGVVTSRYLPDFLTDDLCQEVNEHYLFHGTTFDRIGGLKDIGFRKSAGGMLGSGIYQAEKSTKANQYADPTDARSPDGHRLKIILSRTLLGDVFLCNKSNLSMVQGRNSPPSGYDSVMADGDWLFREFVVYDESLVYPEFVVTYKRA
ncbi:poly [ADP-ribose] polymerase tankyrase-like [Physella acuta]|uniref:poly [ADP-ribose] polymerase tankyrase-like n=1 Tax=Physella acuta TaxID=109671 RepID=UPI0027DDFB88|nr:poly [ADP-ribose] polymerase tankyrase-like [Physella acuta]XP_059158973.1 poly [ADP-ribose] polymerase tankyrase-like [Physella acuta]XP_059158974.1 poly [ADP-ribose] polymerase tankyrase-like [Physella acuta]